MSEAPVVAWNDEVVTRRSFLIEQCLIQATIEGHRGNVFLMIEAVDSTAIDHPEWDMTEEKTRREWLKELES